MHKTAATQDKCPSNIARQGKQVQYGKENTWWDLIAVMIQIQSKNIQVSK